MYETVKKYPTLHIFAININRDHVHIQLEAPPNLSIASVVQKLKGVSGLEIRKRFKFIREAYFEKERIWSVGYFVSSIRLNESQIHQYIEWQGKKEVPQTVRAIQASKQKYFEFE